MGTRVLAIPVNRADKTLMGYLTRARSRGTPGGSERSCWRGRRDHAWRLTWSNRGARVSDVTTWPRDHVCCGATNRPRPPLAKAARSARCHDGLTPVELTHVVC